MISKPQSLGIKLTDRTVICQDFEKKLKCVEDRMQN